jgi:hypothetical protein
MRVGLKTGIAITIAFVLGIVGGSTYAKQDKPEFVSVPAGAAKFAPIDPGNPKGAQMAILWGDPKVGPIAYLIKLTRGASPVHWHSNDYYAFTIEGTTRHSLIGKEAEAKEDAPGTFRYQPGGSAANAHQDECLSDHCLVFGYMTGKYDLNRIAPAKK